MLADFVVVKFWLSLLTLKLILTFKIKSTNRSSIILQTGVKTAISDRHSPLLRFATILVNISYFISNTLGVNYYTPEYF